MKRHIGALGASGVLCVASSAASAHVKWFAPFDAAEPPVAVTSMPMAIWPILILVVVVFCAATHLERTVVGTAFLKVCEVATTAFHARIEDLIRGSSAVFFAALALDGGMILTPELKTDASWVPIVQAAIAVGMFWRSTLPFSALGIVALLLFGMVSYGSFHMMDYPVFLGLAAFFALSSSGDPQQVERRFAIARYGLAFSLMWAAVEKWAYPHWVGHILEAHPHLGMGMNPQVFIALAGAVEFGLGFGLLWTPAIRKASAGVLAFMMTAAIVEFGAVDALGHLLLVVILIATLAERHPTAQERRSRSLMLAPAAQTLALALIVGGYYGGHYLSYGPGQANAVQVAEGATTHHSGSKFASNQP